MQVDFDVIVAPARRILSWPRQALFIPLIASGPAELALESFEFGCSDFIREPWTETELHARAYHHAKKRFMFGSEGTVVVDRRLIGPETSIALSVDAYRILSLLNANDGRPVPRSAIASVLGILQPTSRAVDMRMARIRTILRSAGARDTAKSLHCEHGAYSFHA